MSLSETQSLLDDLAARLQRSVTVTDPQIRHLCGSAHYGDEDEARVRAILQRAPVPDVFDHIVRCGVLSWVTPGRVPAVPSLGFRARVAVPLRASDSLLGFLMIIDSDGSLTDDELGAVGIVADAITRNMDRARRMVHEENLWTERLLLDLVGDEPVRRRAARDALVERHGIPDDARAMVAVVRIVTAPEIPDASRRTLAVREGIDTASRRGLARFFFYARKDRAALFQLVDPRLEEANPAQRLTDVVRNVTAALGPGARCVAGLENEPVPLLRLWRSHQRALLAARAAALLPARGDVVNWSDLGIVSFLLDLPTEKLKSSVPQALRILLENDPNEVLGTTLRIYLDHAGSVPDSASALHLHRSSLYYRLHQIERLTKMDLSNGEHRLTLHLGLKMLDVIAARH
jgi:sugar diacid utilization regulator